MTSGKTVALTLVKAVTFDSRFDRLQLYPAVLFMHTLGIAATYRGREDLVIQLLSDTHDRIPSEGGGTTPAAQALHYNRILNDDLINSFPRWNNLRWLFPASHLLIAELREPFRELIPNENDYRAAAHGFDYRLGLIQQHTQGPGAYRAVAGEFVDEHQWSTYDDDAIPLAEAAFRSSMKTGDNAARWTALLDDGDDLGTASRTT